MSGLVGILSYGIGTLLGFALIGLLVFWFVQDIMPPALLFLAYLCSAGGHKTA